MPIHINPLFQHLLLANIDARRYKKVSTGYPSETVKAFSHYVLMRIGSVLYDFIPDALQYCTAFSTEPLSMRIEMKLFSEVVSCGPMRIDLTVAPARDTAGRKWREE